MTQAPSRPAGLPGQFKWRPDPLWRVRQTSSVCRAGAGNNNPGCYRAPEVEFNRGRTNKHGIRADAWWGYCLEHAWDPYQRKLIDGQVWGWVWVGGSHGR